MISALVELRAVGTDYLSKLCFGSPKMRIQILNYSNLANGFKCIDCDICLSGSSFTRRQNSNSPVSLGC